LIEKIVEIRGVGKRQAAKYYPALYPNLDWIKNGQETLYRPKVEVWKQHIELRQHAIELDAFVKSTVAKSIIATKSINKVISDKVMSEASSLIDKGNEAEAFDIAINHVSEMKPEEPTKAKFYELFNALMKSCLDPLTDQTVYARLDFDAKTEDFDFYYP